MAAKDIHGFLNEVDNYNHIRNLVNIIYLRGSMSSGDLFESGRLNVSKRTIDDSTRRLRNYFTILDESSYDTHQHPGRKKDRKIPHLRHDLLLTSCNYLANTFRQHTISPADVIFYLYFLQVISFDQALDSGASPYEYYEEDCEDLLPNFPPLNKQGFSSKDMYDRMAFIYQSNSALLDKLEPDCSHSSVFPLSQEQVDARLEEMCGLGICTKASSSEENLYILYPSMMDDEVFGADAKIFQDAITDLESLIKFFYNYSAFTIPGVLLFDKLNRYTRINSGESAGDDFKLSIAKNDIFFKNPRFQNIIDDDVVWSLLQSILKVQPITYTYRNVQQNSAKKIMLLPIKIVSELQYGRHYIFGWQYSKRSHYTTGEFVLHRIDRIDEISDCGDIPDSARLAFAKLSIKTPTEDIYKSLEDIYQKHFANTWNVSLTTEKRYTVRLRFCFPEENAEKWTEYLRSTCPKEHLAPVEDKSHCYDYTCIVSDYAELIPWINSFGDTVQVDKETSPELFQEIQKTVKDTLSLYETL